MGDKAAFIAALDNTGMTVSGDTFTANTGTDQLAITGHGRLTGDGPLAVSSTGTAPAPLTVLAATGVLTATDQPTDGETVTIDGHVYTFVDTLAVADDILIGIDLAATLDDLLAAINGDSGEGTKYGTGTVAHTTVEATASDATTVSLAAITAGIAGNEIATTETAADASFGAATLTGGQDNAFYVIVINANAIKLANSYADAVAETPVPLDITTAGTGTHTLSSSVGLFADRIEAEMLEMQANGNRTGIKDVLESRFWDGLIASL